MLPLAGVKVIEFCQVLAGPFCGCLLADMGADVIKVEPPDGDLMRAWPPLRDGYSQYFASVNRNKRSVALDLKDAAGLDAARRLALSADVVIENFRPGVMAKFGLDHATLAQDKPALVYCSVSAFGQSGPRAKEGGFDMTLQAMSGVMSVTGEADGRPVKCGIPIADFTAGLYAAFSVVSALHKANRGAGGDHLDVSMLGAMLGIANLQTSEYFGTGRDPVRLGSAHPMNAPYAAFRCRDGYFALAAGTDKLWQAACEGIGRPDLMQDARFASPSLRAQHQHELGELLEQAFANYDGQAAGNFQRARRAVRAAQQLFAGARRSAGAAHAVDRGHHAAQWREHPNHRLAATRIRPAARRLSRTPCSGPAHR